MYSILIVYKKLLQMNIQLEPNDRYFLCGAFLFDSQGKPMLHLVMDESDTDHTVRPKLPGGKFNPTIDTDSDIWLAHSIKPLLETSGFSAEEIGIIVNYFLNKEISMIERTLIREYLGETGYFPFEFFLSGTPCEKPNNESSDGKFYFIGFGIESLLVAINRVGDTEIPGDDGLTRVTQVTPDMQFQPADLAIKNPRMVMSLGRWKAELLPGHFNVVSQAYVPASYMHKGWPNLS